MKKLQELKKHLRPGQVYRREDLAKWSSSVDRHLKELVKAGDLMKASASIHVIEDSFAHAGTPAESGHTQVE